jgi:hypothetical protein
MECVSGHRFAFIASASPPSPRLRLRRLRFTSVASASLQPRCSCEGRSGIRRAQFATATLLPTQKHGDSVRDKQTTFLQYTYLVILSQ